MPILETERLVIRPFRLEDLDRIYRILDIELNHHPVSDPTLIAQREQWLQWSVLNYSELSKLNQPPFGDRAVVLKTSEELIGACGLAPIVGPFETLPSFQCFSEQNDSGLYTTHFGLYYAISLQYQRQGYASEAARALVDYAFRELRLHWVVATTTYNNSPSQGVMQKIGMRIERNPHPIPEWFQIVGVIQNPDRVKEK